MRFSEYIGRYAGDLYGPFWEMRPTCCPAGSNIRLFRLHIEGFHKPESEALEALWAEFRAAYPDEAAPWDYVAGFPLWEQGVKLKEFARRRHKPVSQSGRPKRRTGHS